MGIFLFFRHNLSQSLTVTPETYGLSLEQVGVCGHVAVATQSATMAAVCGLRRQQQIAGKAGARDTMAAGRLRAVCRTDGQTQVCVCRDALVSPESILTIESQ